jgi:hypothetical protein
MIDLEQVLGKKRRGNSVIVYNNDEIDFRPFAFVLNVKELVNTLRPHLRWPPAVWILDSPRSR